MYINDIWRFPKIEVPLVIIHFRWVLSTTKAIHFRVPPFIEKPHIHPYNGY